MGGREDTAGAGKWPDALKDGVVSVWIFPSSGGSLPAQQAASDLIGRVADLRRTLACAPQRRSL